MIPLNTRFATAFLGVLEAAEKSLSKPRSTVVLYNCSLHVLDSIILLPLTLDWFVIMVLGNVLGAYVCCLLDKLSLFRPLHLLHESWDRSIIEATYI